MSSMRLLKGNEAVVIGSLLGGSTHYFGYPITPASEIAHTAASLYPKCGRVFLQTECEISSISMLYGAAAAGGRVLTGTSGLGLSLMAEQLSYISAAELPCVIVDVQRVGPGLGNIWPEQSDYNCTVKGGGHGSYHVMVLAPESVQEMCDFAYRAFELAEKWKMPVIILTDGYIGQMMGPVILPTIIKRNPVKPWALCHQNKANRDFPITTIQMNPDVMSAVNQRLLDKYNRMKETAVEYQEIQTDDADYVLVAFGISARIARATVKQLRAKGVKIGLLRPITLFPFPQKPIAALAAQKKHLLVLELNIGQMVEDVRLAAAGQAPVTLLNWMGGIIPSAEDVVERIETELHL